MTRKGLLQLYIGDGKGKTTAAVGQSIRALGWGFKVLFAQFLKSSETGEKEVLTKLDGVEFYRPKMRNKGFIWNMDRKALDETREDLNTGFDELVRKISDNEFNLVVLDEVLDVVDCGFVSESRLIDLAEKKPESIELIFTGRKASDSLKEKAHYITAVTSEKHPYSQGISARKGIEY